MISDLSVFVNAWATDEGDRRLPAEPPEPREPCEPQAEPAPGEDDLGDEEWVRI